MQDNSGYLMLTAFGYFCANTKPIVEVAACSMYVVKANNYGSLDGVLGVAGKDKVESGRLILSADEPQWVPT